MQQLVQQSTTWSTVGHVDYESDNEFVTNWGISISRMKSSYLNRSGSTFSMQHFYISVGLPGKPVLVRRSGQSPWIPWVTAHGALLLFLPKSQEGHLDVHLQTNCSSQLDFPTPLRTPALGIWFFCVEFLQRCSPCWRATFNLPASDGVTRCWTGLHGSYSHQN